MTLRSLVACASPLADGNIIRDHLAAIDCDNLGPGGGIIIDTEVNYITEAQAMTLQEEAYDTIEEDHTFDKVEEADYDTITEAESDGDIIAEEGDTINEI